MFFLYSGFLLAVGVVGLDGWYDKKLFKKWKTNLKMNFETNLGCVDGFDVALQLNDENKICI